MRSSKTAQFLSKSWFLVVIMAACAAFVAIAGSSTLSSAASNSQDQGNKVVYQATYQVCMYGGPSAGQDNAAANIYVYPNPAVTGSDPDCISGLTSGTVVCLHAWANSGYTFTGYSPSESAISPCSNYGDAGVTVEGANVNIYAEYSGGSSGAYYSTTTAAPQSYYSTSTFQSFYSTTTASPYYSTTTASSGGTGGSGGYLTVTMVPNPSGAQSSTAELYIPGTYYAVSGSGALSFTNLQSGTIVCLQAEAGSGYTFTGYAGFPTDTQYQGYGGSCGPNYGFVVTSSVTGYADYSGSSSGSSYSTTTAASQSYYSTTTTAAYSTTTTAPYPYYSSTTVPSTSSPQYSVTMVPQPSNGQSPSAELYIPGTYFAVTGAGTLAFTNLAAGSDICLHALPASGYTFTGYAGFPPDTLYGGACGSDYGFVVSSSATGYAQYSGGSAPSYSSTTTTPTAPSYSSTTTAATTPTSGGTFAVYMYASSPPGAATTPTAGTTVYNIDSSSGITVSAPSTLPGYSFLWWTAEPNSAGQSACTYAYASLSTLNPTWHFTCTGPGDNTVANIEPVYQACSVCTGSGTPTPTPPAPTPSTYTVTMSPDPSGAQSSASQLYDYSSGKSVSGQGALTLTGINSGDVVCLEAEPASGYTFTGYAGFPTDTEYQASCGANYGFIATADASGNSDYVASSPTPLTPSYSSTTTVVTSAAYAITMTPSPAAGQASTAEIYVPGGQTVSGSGTLTLQAVPAGQVICLQAEPVSGYSFSGYSGFPTDTQATAVNPSGACGGNYGFVVSGPANGQAVYTSISPPEGSLPPSGSSYSSTTTVAASTGPIYSVTMTPNPSGSQSPSAELYIPGTVFSVSGPDQLAFTNLAAGTDVCLHALAASSFAFSGYSGFPTDALAGGACGSDYGFVVTNSVSGQADYEPAFTLYMYGSNPGAATGPIAEGTPEYGIPQSGTVTVTTSIPSGYTFSGWELNGGPIPVGQPACTDWGWDTDPSQPSATLWATGIAGCVINVIPTFTAVQAVGASASAQSIWSALIGAGATPLEAAGIMGNAAQETGGQSFQSINVEEYEGNGACAGMVCWTTNFGYPSGYSYGSFVTGNPSADLQSQVTLLQETGAFGAASGSTPAQAAASFAANYERCGICNDQAREAQAQAAYSTFT